MPKLVFTSAASKLAQEAKKQGLSLREIAEKLRKDLGIDVDHVTVSRHLKRIAGEARDRSPETESSPQKGTATGQRTVRNERNDLPDPQSPPTLDETEALERQVVTLQTLLQADMPPKDRAALNGELRQTFAAIRKARSAASTVQVASDDELRFVDERLRRFAAANKSADGMAPDTDAVPPIADSASG